MKDAGLKQSERRARKRADIGIAFLVALLLTLTACGSPSVSPPQREPERFDYSLSVDISPQTSRAELEAKYGAKIVVWRPEAGFAVLGLHDTGGLRTQGAKKNGDAFEVPEVTKKVTHGNGHTSWSGGRNAWSGGRNAWSGGRDAHGSELTTFTKNLAYWDQVNLPEAQALAPSLGKGVVVAVIDTGIDLAHPAFADKLTPAHEWKDFVDGDAHPQEVKGTNYGHGTGVADLILQVAPNVTLLPIRALGPDGAGDTLDVIAAIDYAVQQGADIVNLSLGTDTQEKVLKKLVKYATKQEVLIVASVGNSGAKNIMFPARYGDEVLSVGSVNGQDEFSTFSAYGKALDLTAPGETLLTASPERGVMFWSGTSFSTPIVSGAAALALGENHPKVKAKTLGKKLANTSDDIRNVGGNGLYKKNHLGEGRLDIEDFLKKVLK